MEEFRRFRLLTVRLSLLATAVAAACVFPFHAVASKALLGGGIGGVLAFWIVAFRTEKLASRGGNALKSGVVRLTLLRVALYAVVLGWAYTLDRDSIWGIVAAASGLFIVRFVVVILGLTGLDLRAEERNGDGAHR